MVWGVLSQLKLWANPLPLLVWFPVRWIKFTKTDVTLVGVAQVTSTDTMAPAPLATSEAWSPSSTVGWRTD